MLQCYISAVELGHGMRPPPKYGGTVSAVFNDHKKPGADHTKRVKELVRTAWNVNDDIVIMVSELRCHEDGCPDLETVIALMAEDADPKTIKINKPIAELDLAVITSYRPT